MQRKGWLGASNDKYKDGDNNFLSNLFIQSGCNEGFYPIWLKTLFFDTLNNPLKKGDFKMPDGTIVKIPFLNGGLFDKDDIDNYDFTIPADLFHNETQSELPLKRGFFDFLNAFNFTIYEDSPDDHTVAVDPEMLGHIFENLLEDNKDKGAFYTPKQIVHYMCQESLIQYLITNYEPGNDDKNKNSIENLIHNKYLDNHLNFGIINELLDKVKICDPAIGSGAFPVGLLHEIFSLKEIIADHFGKELNRAEAKENIIQNSIYGVDIEKGAVDIARLRFWLSLLVDQDMPNALPNLDYKIIVGNSLLSKFENEIIEIDWSNDTTSVGVFAQSNRLKSLELLKTISSKQSSYFHIKTSDKKKLTAEIRNLKIDLLINQLDQMIKTKGLGAKPSGNGKKIKEQTELYTQTEDWKRAIRELNTLKNDLNKPFNHFDWKLDFPEVLNPFITSNPGFDIVIANPPYVKEATNKSAFDGLKSHSIYQGKMDLWYFFGYLGILLSKENTGISCFIATNNWITNDGASKFRNFILQNSYIEKFDDFGDYKIFVSAGIQTMIYLLKRNTPIEIYNVQYSRLSNPKISREELVDFLEKPYEISNEINWSKSNVLFSPAKFINKYITFIQSSNIEEISIRGNFFLDENEIYSGIDVLQDCVSKSHIPILEDPNIHLGDGIYVLDPEEVKNLNLKENELSKIRPYYTTSELNRYLSKKENILSIIYSDRELFENIDLYPNIKSHLDRFSKVMTSVNKPYGLHRSREETIFKGEKILSIRKCSIPSFTYCDFDSYVSRAFLIIKSKRISLKYLTALLNSKLIGYWLKIKGKLQGNNYQIDKEPLLSIPLFVHQNKLPFEVLVDYIIYLNDLEKPQLFSHTANSRVAAHIEDILDMMVYELYFENHMKENGIDVLQFILPKPISETKTDVEKAEVIKDFYLWYQKPENPVRQRILLIETRSSDKLALINKNIQ